MGMEVSKLFYRIMPQTLEMEDVMLLKLIPWSVFFLVLSAFTFYLAHGASVAMAFKPF
jgi:hypothetical protein